LQSGKDFVGIEDRYFTAAFLPANGAAPARWRPLLKSWRTVHANGQDTAEPVAQVHGDLGAAAGPACVVGPKDYDDLKKMNRRYTAYQFSAGWNLSRASFFTAEVAAQLHRQWGWPSLSSH